MKRRQAKACPTNPGIPHTIARIVSSGAPAKACHLQKRAVFAARAAGPRICSAFFTPHPVLGEIDCYNSLLLLALHPERHAAQIEVFPMG